MDNKERNEPRMVIAGSPDKPLRLGEDEVPCYVLDDETRVLGRQGIMHSLGLRDTGQIPTSESSVEMPVFLRQKWLQPFISAELKALLKSPILYKTPNGQTAHGYSTRTFGLLCEAILKAHDAGKTTSRQSKIVQRASAIIRGVFRLGIDATVDEITGYEETRTLQELLQVHLAEELQPYEVTFPIEFYQQLCRLFDWPNEYIHNRPGVVGSITNNMVYKRLLAGIHDVLERVNPMREDGTREHYHHQFLSSEIGRPRLKERLSNLISLMKTSDSWAELKYHVDRVFPMPNQQNHLPGFWKTYKYPGSFPKPIDPSSQSQ